MHGLLTDIDRIGFEDPEVGEAFRRGMAYRRSCRYDDAIRELTAAAEQAPDSAIVYYELARSYLLKGDNGRALEELKRAVRFEPDNMDVWFYLRSVSRLSQPLAEALKQAQAAVDTNAGDADAHDLLGVILLMMDSRDCGMQEIQWATELAPDNAEYHLDLGYAESLFDEGEALREAKAALRLKPESVDAWLFLGALYMDLGMEDEAISAYKAAVALDPGNGILHYLLGDAYRSAGKTKAALDEIEVSARLGPDNYTARSALADMYLAEGLEDKAAEQLEALIALEPGIKKSGDRLMKLKPGKKQG